MVEVVVNWAAKDEGKGRWSEAKNMEIEMRKEM